MIIIGGVSRCPECVANIGRFFRFLLLLFCFCFTCCWLVVVFVGFLFVFLLFFAGKAHCQCLLKKALRCWEKPVLV